MSCRSCRNPPWATYRFRPWDYHKEHSRGLWSCEADIPMEDILNFFLRIFVVKVHSMAGPVLGTADAAINKTQGVFTVMKTVQET